MKNYELVQLEELSGPAAKVYSVYLNESDKFTLFEQFLAEYAATHPTEIKNLLARLELMATKYGIVPRFLKTAEGTKATDKLVALFDDEKQLRVYGIWHNCAFIILGGGGLKPPGETIRWQDDPILKKAAETMLAIDRDIAKKVDEGIIEIEGSDIIMLDNED